MKFTSTVEMPTRALNFIMTGDESGLSKSDLHALCDWLDSEVDETYGPAEFNLVLGTKGFSYNPAFGEPCMCEHVRIYIAEPPKIKLPS